MVMCSPDCPCDSQKASEWNSMTELELNAYNRTKVGGTGRLLQSASASASSRGSLNQGDIPLYTMTSAKAQTQSVKLYEVFTECNTDMQAKKDQWTEDNPNKEED